MAVNERDKYYTPDWLVKHTIKKAIEIIGKENITEVVEPSAGDGAFIDQLKLFFNGITYRFYDLYPEHPEVIEQDYKKVRLSYKKGRLTIGNPPFGTSSCLWKAFCKKAATNSDYIAFISPASQYNSNYYFKEGVLVYSELLNDVEYRGSEKENGKNQKVRTCLNIYKVYDREEEEDWRLNKINTIVKYGRIFKGEEGFKEDYDYYLASMTSGKNHCKLCDKNDFYTTFRIKILDEKYRNIIEEFLNNFYSHSEELKNLKAGPPYIDNAFFTNKLKTFLFPTREERLEQDVKILSITNNHSEEQLENRIDDFDYFLQAYGHFKLVNTPTKTPPCWCFKIINDNVKEQVYQFLISFDEKYSDEIKKQTSSGISLRIEFLKEHLIKHLYPTREERLEQDVLITRNETLDCDYYIGRMYNYSLVDKNTLHIGVKILNENIRDKVEEVLKHYEEYIKTDEKADILKGSIPGLKEYLIKHLYPTREERLDQDIEILPNTGVSDKKGDYYISILGDAGHTSKELINSISFPVKILNENIRQKFERSFDIIKELIQNHPSTSIASGGSKSTNIHAIKEVLLQVLYPEDLYDDYPEIRKPIHIERALYAKELF